MIVDKYNFQPSQHKNDFQNIIFSILGSPPKWIKTHPGSSNINFSSLGGSINPIPYFKFAVILPLMLCQAAKVTCHTTHHHKFYLSFKSTALLTIFCQ